MWRGSERGGSGGGGGGGRQAGESVSAAWPTWLQEQLITSYDRIPTGSGEKKLSYARWMEKRELTEKGKANSFGARRRPPRHLPMLLQR